MTVPGIDQWLRKCAEAIDYPLRRRKFKRRHGDVSLGVEVYRTRFGGGFYVEFTIYSGGLPRPGPYESKTVPIQTWRLKNPRLRKSDGFCPDLPMTEEEDPDALADMREQIMAQGNELFSSVHSLPTLAKELRGEIRTSLSEPANEPTKHLASRIESFLEAQAAGKVT